MFSEDQEENIKSSLVCESPKAKTESKTAQLHVSPISGFQSARARQFSIGTSPD